jgi:hypothetical protein
MLVGAACLALLPASRAAQIVSDSQAASAVQRATTVLPALRDSVTLERWLQEHPGDQVLPYRRALVYDRTYDGWCALAESYLPDGEGGKVWRRALFYTPATPFPALLPSNSAANTLMGQCRLGNVLLGFGRAEAIAGDNWLAQPLNSLAASRENEGEERAGWLRLQRMLRLEEALGVAAIGGDVELAMRALLRSTTAEVAPTSMRLAILLGNEVALSTPAADSIALAFGNWMAATRSLASDRRAAALVVGDHVLSAVWPRGAYNFPQKFSPHGAEFEGTTADPGYRYTRNLLAAARDLYAPGRGGEIAFLASLVERADGEGGCHLPVIRRGEEYLRANPASSIRAEVHFMVAESYADIVSFAADSALRPRADSLELAARVQTARARAVEEFRKGIELAGSGAPRSRMAWQTAYRLLAGIPPLQTFWSCE